MLPMLSLCYFCFQPLNRVIIKQKCRRCPHLNEIILPLSNPPEEKTWHEVRCNRCNALLFKANQPQLEQ
jgi:phage FluMu protein Com